MKKFKVDSSFVFNRENRTVKIGDVVELNQKEEKKLLKAGCIDKEYIEQKKEDPPKEDPPKKTAGKKKATADPKDGTE